MVGDFFPYNDKFIMTYWSGYFSTRPVLKKRIREAEALARTADVTLASALTTIKAGGPLLDKNHLDKAASAIEQAKRFVTF